MDISKNGNARIRKHADSFISATSNINFHFWNKGTVETHSHEYFELFLMTEGCATHILNGVSMPLKAGRLCLIRPGEVHSFEPFEKQKSTHFNVRITVPAFQSLCANVHPSLYEQIVKTEKPIKYRLKKHELDYFTMLVHAPSFIYADGTSEDALSTVRVIVCNFLLYINHSLQSEQEYPKWFRDFLGEISSPEAFTLPLSKIYALSGYSQTRLNTYFKQYMGTTLIAYMTKQKLRYACNLLQTSNYSVLQIALMASFNSLSHFNSVFKKETSVTPTQYRDKYCQRTVRF